MGGLFAAAAWLRRVRWAPSLCSCHAEPPYKQPSPPLQEKDEYVENIIADMKRLGLPCDAITYTSDYFPQLKDCGERLIKAGEWRHQCNVYTPYVFRRVSTQHSTPYVCLHRWGDVSGSVVGTLRAGFTCQPAGHMYADDTPVEQMREERMVGTESRCRNRRCGSSGAAAAAAEQATCLASPGPLSGRMHACPAA